ncbi:CcdB family protein [Parvibaculum sp.]|uniref:CcdB family protein n=1 Tax=Parvibaculum sp. TaxID=2024848 RepID=UPI002BC427FC|nr:CcdB family protein [Parvibaculum sp.]HUD50016.1 CcdB family protein [Parvibaculum sp.]
MAQFDLHQNPDIRTRAAMPYVIELQVDLLDDLPTCVVAPLVPAATFRGAIPHLNPILKVEGVPHVLLTQQLAAIPRRALAAPPVSNAEGTRYEIIAAVDFLVTGI